jgi:23S rRNA (cytosine1962-C5)-methyltransferase
MTPNLQQVASTLKPDAKSTLPVVRISGRGSARLHAGHVWVYRSDVISAEGVAPGALVTVADQRGKRLGSALYSNSSQIAIRMISPNAVSDLRELVQQRIRQALAYRELLVQDTDAYRLVFSEGDFLPGLIVDRYNDVLVVQFLTQSMDAEPIRSAAISQLTELLHPAAIIERVDARVRELEHLPPRESGLLLGDKTVTEFRMNGVRFTFESQGAQKTGAFLDQRENYRAAAQYAHGEVMDVFCYQGSFALHMAERATRVTGVDSSRPALEVAEKNAQLNGRVVEWIEGNAFDLLKEYSATGQRYDTIVLDPPAFAKSRSSLETALRGYKEINLRALKMLRPGGFLITCSCSYHVGDQAFLETVAAAALDAHRTVRIVERRGQAKDHPILPLVPETSYLKCVTLSVSN